MLDVKHVKFKECTIKTVEEIKYEDVNLVISTEDDEEFSIKIMSKRMFTEQLSEMKIGKRDRCIWAYGNADIDLYNHEGVYTLLHSPHEGLYRWFKLKDGEFEKLTIKKAA